MKRPAHRAATGTKPTGRWRWSVKPWHERPAGPDQPNWAQHFVDVLRAPLENLRRKLPFPGCAKITIWSDCAGKCTEMRAADKLADELRKQIGVDINFRLYAASDTKQHCRDYVICNFRPDHFADDIFQRDFASSTLQCNTCKNHATCRMLGLISTAAAAAVRWGRIAQATMLYGRKPSRRSST